MATAPATTQTQRGHMDQKEKAWGEGLGMSNEFLRPGEKNAMGETIISPKDKRRSCRAFLRWCQTHIHKHDVVALSVSEYIRLESGLEKGGKQVGGTNPFCRNASSSVFVKDAAQVQKKKKSSRDRFRRAVWEWRELRERGGGGRALARRGRTLACEGLHHGRSGKVASL